jgi:glycosyltransferase involved in cell wall biosynthesis
VTLLALGEPSPAHVEQAAEAGAWLIAEPLKLEWMQDCQDDVRRTRELIARVVRDRQPDVLHANQFAAACAGVDVPVVLTLHSDVLSWRSWTCGTRTTPPEWSAYRGLVREALARADSIVAVSSFLAGETEALYGCQRAIQVIHNGWPSERLAPLSERSLTTLIAGRVWDAAKNIRLAAEAARGWDSGTIYLAGQQTNPESGGRAAVPAPLSALGFLGHARLEALMRSTLIYLSPARYDPFGLLPLQAALNGACLLLSDIPSYREVWGDAAVFFRVDDADDLRDKWSRLLDAPDGALDMGVRARQRALERYTAAHMAHAYADLYSRLGSAHAAVAA